MREEPQQQRRHTDRDRLMRKQIYVSASVCCDMHAAYTTTSYARHMKRIKTRQKTHEKCEI